MLKIETGKSKSIRFGVATTGISARDLQSYLLLEVDGISYQISCTYESGYIKVVIPPLNSFIKSDLKLWQQIPVKLCVKVANEIQTPFADTMTIVKESISIDITSIQQESTISNETRIKETLKRISKSEYNISRHKKSDIMSKETKKKSNFFKKMSVINNENIRM